MAQTCFDKIISLHLEECGRPCPHSSSCYLRKREDVKRKKPVDVVDLLSKGYVIHEAICNNIEIFNDEFPNTIDLLRYSPNYNITISYNLFMNYISKLTKFRLQVQISVYTEEQVKLLNDWQKLYLIKDDETYEFACTHWNIPYRYLHFNFDQEYMTKDKIQQIGMYTVLSNSIGITMDSCAANYANFGRCMYEGNYIDISFDGTFRVCPFNRCGMNLPDNIVDAFKAKCTPDKCIYKNMFSKEIK